MIQDIVKTPGDENNLLPNHNDEYVYIIVREDLSKPQQIVQSSHAAIEAARFYLTENSKHPFVIVCGIPSEEYFQEIFQYLECKSIKFQIFREPDIGNKITAIATQPLDRYRKKVMSKFQLIK